MASCFFMLLAFLKIRSHIPSFPTVNWKQGYRRKYLAAGLSVERMHFLFNEQQNANGKPTVGFSIYRRLFNTEFNYAFLKAPKKKVQSSVSIALQYFIQIFLYTV